MDYTEAEHFRRKKLNNYYKILGHIAERLGERDKEEDYANA